MSKYIVTVKLPKNPKHDPRNKVTGTCPIDPGATCTDVTGQHHSFLIDAAHSLEEAFRGARLLFDHVTRVEQVDD